MSSSLDQVGERAVEIPGSKAFQVEGDVRVAGGLDRSDDVDATRDHVAEALDRQLDPCRVAIVADAKLGEPQSFQRGLGAIDLAEQTHGDLGSIRHPTGQASCGRLVPRSQTEGARRGADIGLRETCPHQREHGTALIGRTLTGAVVAEVVEVDAQHDRGIAGVGDRPDDVHQLGLAVIATIAVVDPIRGALHLVRDHRCPLQFPFLGEGAAVGLFVAGERWGYRCDGVCAVAQFLLSDGGEERAVGSSAERHDHSAEPPELSA